MAVYGSFVYGYGYVYGEATVAVTDATFINSNVIEISLVNEVVIDDEYYDLTNYTITTVSGNSIRLRKVLENKNPTKVTTKIYLVTDVAQEGSEYSIFLMNLNNRDGTLLIPVTVNVICRRTKTDNVLQSLPGHFDKRPESILKNVITAIANSDEEIGGSRDQEF